MARKRPFYVWQNTQNLISGDYSDGLNYSIDSYYLCNIDVTL